MLDHAEGSDNFSMISTVKELVLRSGRLTCGKEVGNKKLPRLGVLSGFDEASCWCFAAFSCMDGRVGGAFHTKLGRVCLSIALVL